MIFKRQMFLRGLALVLVAGGAIGCATPGPPQPPSLKVPKPITDLSAAKTGGSVALSWTAPKETTDDENLRRPGKTRVCRDFSTSTAGDDVHNSSDHCTMIAEVPSLVGVHQEYSDRIPPDLAQKTGLLVYRLQVFSSEGRADDPSKAVIVPIAPTLPSPRGLRLEAGRQGITVAWKNAPAPQAEGVEFFYLILRRDTGSSEWKEIHRLPAADASAHPELSYQDTAPEFGHDYDYAVAPLSRFALGGQEYEVRGDQSEPQTIGFRDVFPPAAPSGLQAVYAGVPGQDAIDLSWNPEQERDLAGYNIYRHEEGAPPARLNGELLAAPAYHDGKVSAGRRYFYSVTAVDSHGVESKPSVEASEIVPAESQK